MSERKHLKALGQPYPTPTFMRKVYEKGVEAANDEYDDGEGMFTEAEKKRFDQNATNFVMKSNHDFIRTLRECYIDDGYLRSDVAKIVAATLKGYFERCKERGIKFYGGTHVQTKRALNTWDKTTSPRVDKFPHRE